MVQVGGGLMDLWVRVPFLEGSIGYTQKSAVGPIIVGRYLTSETNKLPEFVQ
jgi:hypothetical protein